MNWHGRSERAAVIAFVVVLLSLLTSADIPSAVPLIGALAGLIGDVLVGYLTVRAGIFPAWVGWALAAARVVNFVTGLPPGSLALSIVAGVFAMVGAVAIAGYGWKIVQSARGATLRPA